MIIAGLGNPGTEYEKTRHNVGFWAADALCEHFKTHWSQTRFSAKIASFHFKGSSHILMKPQTYMNLSGDSVRAFLHAEKLLVSDLFVIVDDISLPVGKMRLRPSGSSGGHNGLKSIIGYLGEGFWRLRIGVGMPESQNMVSHVLGEASPEEMKVLGDLIKDLPQIVFALLTGSAGRAMSKFNGRNYCLPPLEDPGK
jgi:PTH1 family peptidyl-tRNA hydrolase